MGGISTGIGIFSGINSQQLISQLLAIESRPKILAQGRIAQLQSQQAAYLDLNTRLGALREAAAAFRVKKSFQTKQATSSASDILSAKASTEAVPGSYSFIVHKLVSTQQLLSKGFTDAGTTGIGATGFTFESEKARLDRDMSLADLNGGTGVERGKIIITDSDGKSATIDLSKAATVNDVLEAINSNGAVSITASVDGDRFVVTHADPAKNITITNGFGSTTAASLGILKTTFTSHVVTGSDVYGLASVTALQSLNDGNGIFVGHQVGSGAYDFRIVVDAGAGPVNVDVNLGTLYDAQSKPTDPAVTTMGGAIARINDALDAAGFGDVTASIKTDGTGLRIVDAAGDKTLKLLENPTTTGTTARDLGFTTGQDFTGSISGSRILASMNSTLARQLNGASGIEGDGVISIIGRDGQNYTVNIDTQGSVAQVLAAFSADTGGMFSAALDKNGTGLVITDNTGGSGNLIVSGDTAASLGIATEPGGVESSTVASGNLQHAYMTLSTLVSSLNNGKGIGTGVFRITDSTGATDTVDIGSDTKTLEDLIKEINGKQLRAKARINSRGDGVELYEEVPGGGSPGTIKMKVEDVTGSVAARLNLKKEAAGTGADNLIDGSFERTVAFEPTDTLETIAKKINEAQVGVAASIVNDGAGGTPFRLSLSSTASGSAGRFILDSGAFDLGLKTLDAGQDSIVFYGSTDPAKGILLQSSSNTLDKVISGVTIDLHSAAEKPVQLTIARDTGAAEAAIDTFISAFNTAIDRIVLQTKYTEETKAKGPLLGDSTALTLRSSLYTAVQGEAIGVSGPFTRLSDVGLTVGAGGKLQLDRDRLRLALEEDPQAVADLFAARTLKPKEDINLGNGVTVKNPDAPDEFIALGVPGLVEELVKSYSDTINGVLTRRKNTLNTQITAQQNRIKAFDARLESRRLILERQFIAMEQAISRLQSQQGALSTIASLSG